jgi:amino acid transporter
MTDSQPSPHLERGLNLLHATSLNVANMLGAGPFFTIPVLLGTMMGPQAMIGWVVAMVIVTCDGLVWAELGAAFPGTGGTYHYLRTIFHGSPWGRLLPFLFLWQFLISGTLEVASGYIAASQFTMSLWPAYGRHALAWGLTETAAKGILASVMVVIMFILLCQRIRSLGWLGTVLVAGVLATVGSIIVLGVKNFDPALISFPPGAFHVDKGFLMGLGAATSVAVYDYLGYYNICNLGEEVRNPKRTIPRSVLLSIVIVAAIYMSMNVSILGVVPWQEAIMENSAANENIVGAFMTRLCGETIAGAFTILIIWTCLAGLFAMTIGYSRIVFAAANNGDFFGFFAKLHPTRGYPWAALALLSTLTAIFCFFDLDAVIEGAVAVRILVQFIGQIIALHVVHQQKKHLLPFRMWLYPVPSLIALAGWVLLLATTTPFLLQLIVSVYASGFLVYILRNQIHSQANSS